MSDFQRPQDSHAQGAWRWRDIAVHARRPVAVYLAGRPPRPEGRVVFATVLLSSPNSRPWRCRSPSSGRPMRSRSRHRARWRRAIGWFGVCRTHCDDARLWRRARRDGAAHTMARRHFRQGAIERGAAAGDAHLEHMHLPVAAIPSRAQDRRADAGPRTPAATPSRRLCACCCSLATDHRRTGADRRRAAVAFRLALRRRHRSHGCAVHVVHLRGHEWRIGIRRR